MIDSTLAASIAAPEDAVPEERLAQFKRVFSMTHPQEQESLYAMSRYGYSGEGEIWDIGCAAGGSSYFLAAGLEDRAAAGPAEQVKCFDIFSGGSKHLLGPYFPEAENDLDIFRQQTRPVQAHVEAVPMDLISGFSDYPSPRKVEIAHIDAAKSVELWKAIFPKLCANILPGKSVWIFQDFERARLPWHAYSLWEILPYGQILGGASYGTLYFRLESEIPVETQIKIREDAFTLKERLENIRQCLALMRKDFEALFPESVYSLADVETAMSAYCHFWAEDRVTARRLLLGTSERYRADPTNQIYVRELIAGA